MMKKLEGRATPGLQSELQCVGHAEDEAAHHGAHGVVFAEDNRREGNEAAAGGHVLAEVAKAANGEESAAQSRHGPADGAGDVAVEVNADAHGGRCAGILANGAQGEAPFGFGDDEPGQRHHDDGDVEVDVLPAEKFAKQDGHVFGVEAVGGDAERNL